MFLKAFKAAILMKRVNRLDQHNKINIRLIEMLAKMMKKTFQVILSSKIKFSKRSSKITIQANHYGDNITKIKLLQLSFKNNKRIDILVNRMMIHVPALKVQMKKLITNNQLKINKFLKLTSSMLNHQPSNSSIRATIKLAKMIKTKSQLK